MVVQNTTVLGKVFTRLNTLSTYAVRFSAYVYFLFSNPFLLQYVNSGAYYIVAARLYIIAVCVWIYAAPYNATKRTDFKTAHLSKAIFKIDFVLLLVFAWFALSHAHYFKIFGVSFCIGLLIGLLFHRANLRAFLFT